MEKEFKTYSEMIELLESRGISYTEDSSKDYAQHVLEKVGYYNLINGYNKIFLDPVNQNQYKKGTTIREIHALYQFDSSLRHIFFKYVLTVETNIKSLISYYFSEFHGHKNYLTYDNFNTSIKDATPKITALIAEIQKQIANRAKDPCISHYLTHHGYIPLWVLNNILTFGTISKFYSLMQIPERQKVSKAFGILDSNFENGLMYISSVRNFCAHGNRLYCYRTKNPLYDTNFHKSMNLSKNASGEYIYGKRDLFGCLIALKLLLSRSDFSRMCKEIYYSIGALDKKLYVLKREEILTEMGFPTDWMNLKTLK